MSHYASFSFTALAVAEIPQHFDNQALAEFSADLPFTGQSAGIRHIFGQTRSDWLKWVARDLLAKTPYQRLQFLAADYLKLPTEPTADYEFDEDEFQSDFYTVIAPNQLNPVLNDLNDFLTWCSTHIAEVSEVLEWGHEEIQAALERNQAFQTNVNHCHWGEDGDTPDFFFYTLKAMQVILQYAISHGLYAVYENENSTGLNIPIVTLLKSDL